MQKELVVQVALFKKSHMKYVVTKWTIKKLFDIYKKGQLNLSPNYQRNFIWSIKDQRYLIASIERHNPIPNFFILQIDKNKFEMVDGQQRSRTILGFLGGQFVDENGKQFSQVNYPDFLKYEFPVTIITDTEGQSIEQFYALVNKTGIHLNKPEVRKADFYETKMLQVVNEVIESKKFKKLNIFSETSLKRMNDVEFISELVVLILKGHVDKKNHLDEYFKNDLTTDDLGKVRTKFNLVFDKINQLNEEYSISKSRYKQRNDFYTLFDFILNHLELSQATLSIFYQILLRIAPDIKPSQSNCIPLRDYARNCVTQSNSKEARQHRLKFFEELLLNTSASPNNIQKQIATFYGIKLSSFLRHEGYLIFEPSTINSINS